MNGSVDVDVQVAKAKETEAQIDVELKELQATLANIEEARPFEDLTVRPSSSSRLSASSHQSTFSPPLTHLYIHNHIRVLQAEDVAQAHPRIVEAVETMLKKGKWTVPGAFALLFTLHFFAFRPLPRFLFTHMVCFVFILQATRRSSATFRSCKGRDSPYNALFCWCSGCWIEIENIALDASQDDLSWWKYTAFHIKTR